MVSASRTKICDEKKNSRSKKLILFSKENREKYSKELVNNTDTYFLAASVPHDLSNNSFIQTSG